MLTKRENMLATIRGGCPDRLVNQYEAIAVMPETPAMAAYGSPAPGQSNVQDSFGVWRSWPETQPGAYPLHDAEHLLVDDIEEWRDKVKDPQIPEDEESWAHAIEKMAEIDRNEVFASVVVAPGIFEYLHAFQGMADAMANFIAEPELTHEIIDFMTDVELKIAELNCKYLHPDLILHHDDWGSDINTFMSVEMFDEFITPAYKKIYKYYKDHGVQVIVHHSDSYAETLVPSMIEMGIDVWQGATAENNIPAIIEAAGGKLTVMGGLDSQIVDVHDWSPEKIETYVRNRLDELGERFLIPCITQGAAGSVYPGVYDCLTDVIKKINFEKFGFPVEEQ